MGLIHRCLLQLPSFRRKPESRETDWIPCQARNDIRYPAACFGVVYFERTITSGRKAILQLGRKSAVSCRSSFILIKRPVLFPDQLPVEMIEEHSHQLPAPNPSLQILFSRKLVKICAQEASMGHFDNLPEE